MNIMIVELNKFEVDDISIKSLLEEKRNVKVRKAITNILFKFMNNAGITDKFISSE